MESEPAHRISRKALTLWRIYGAIYVGITVLISIGLGITILLWDWPVWLIGIATAIILVEIIFLVWLIPGLKWERWRYDVREQEIELQHGILIIKRTLVPMVRVQHVDTEQGPLLRKFRLSAISISTAATIHRVPALDEEEAEELRQSISSLARVAEDDV